VRAAAIKRRLIGAIERTPSRGGNLTRKTVRSSAAAMTRGVQPHQDATERLACLGKPAGEVPCKPSMGSREHEREVRKDRARECGVSPALGNHLHGGTTGGFCERKTALVAFGQSDVRVLGWNCVGCF